jgi:predicted PurR-regulated permease PerM
VRIARWFRGRRSLSAGVLSLGVVLLIILPVVSMSAFLVDEAADGVRYVSKTVRSEGVSGLLQKLPHPVQRAVQALQQRFGGDEAGLREVVEKQVTAQGGKAAAVVGAAVAATGSLLFQGTLMVVAFFFFLVGGQDLLRWLDQTLPLKSGQTHELFREFKTVSYSVLVSSVVTAAVQSIVALVGYLIARLPHPIFFTAVTFLVAFIPGVGAAGAGLAAALLLLITGHPYGALFLAVWAILVVGLIDNVIKPLLIKGGMQMHGAVVFFALIGGLAAFGTIGLLLGPLVVALFMAMVRMYRRDFLHVQAPPPAPQTRKEPTA